MWSRGAVFLMKLVRDTLTDKRTWELKQRGECNTVLLGNEHPKPRGRV